MRGSPSREHRHDAVSFTSEQSVDGFEQVANLSRAKDRNLNASLADPSMRASRRSLRRVRLVTASHIVRG